MDGWDRIDVQAQAAATDGERIFAVLYANDDCAPILYIVLSQTEGRGLMVLSELLGSQAQDWHEVPMSQIVTAHDGNLEEAHFAPQRT